jgi:hypothetical protein
VKSSRRYEVGPSDQLARRVGSLARYTHACTNVVFDASDLYASAALNLASTLGTAVARTTTTSTCAFPMIMNELEAFAETRCWPATHMCSLPP